MPGELAFNRISGLVVTHHPALANGRLFVRDGLPLFEAVRRRRLHGPGMPAELWRILSTGVSGKSLTMLWLAKGQGGLVLVAHQPQNDALDCALKRIPGRRRVLLGCRAFVISAIRQESTGEYGSDARMGTLGTRLNGPRTRTVFRLVGFVRSPRRSHAVRAPRLGCSCPCSRTPRRRDRRRFPNGT